LDDILTADRTHAKRMEQGSIWLRDAIALARANDPGRMSASDVAPAALRWFEVVAGPAWQRGPVTAGSRAEMERHVARIQERDRKADSLRVSRDPCPLCAVRGDIGCKHRRAA
jgi:hypothetical protein